MTHLLVTVRFFEERYHGLLDRDGPPEWPPSPFRLFQALVAGVARHGDLDSVLGESLAWLQTLDPPTIIAPRSRPGQVVTRFVPNNDGDKKPDRQNRLKGKTSRPTLMLDPPAIHYLWLIGVAGEDQARLVCQAARCLSCLGWGIDLAYAEARLIGSDEIAGLLGVRWRPHKGIASDSGLLRVPVFDSETNENTLSDLKAAHQSALNRIDRGKPLITVDKPKVFGRVFYDSPERPYAHPYAAFKLLHPEEDRWAWFSATRANCVAAMTRHATANAANQQQRERAWVDSYVHGHRSPGEDTKPRFSYLPLPTIEHRGQGALVVGGVRRVILAELTETSTSYRSWARQILPGQFLSDERTGDNKAMLSPLNESDWVLRQYTDPSDNWATVTPVVLPGSDDGKFAKAKKLFFKALSHAGYAAAALAADPEFRNVSFWPRGELALRFKRPDYLRNGCWSVYHVRLRWKQPIKGPVALGAGRHCGLGIFAAMRG
jgi:CRISPR-associated protein Csb2